MDLIKDFPQFKFQPGRFNMWSPHTHTIYFDTRRIKSDSGKAGLLHEIGHGLLGHRLYKYDMELLKMEMEAWDVVRQLGPKYGITIDEKHIARCISTYDNWLSKRATCPDCNNFSLQKDRCTFGCFACGSKWKVNERKDRRVTRKILDRWEPLHSF